MRQFVRQCGPLGVILILLLVGLFSLLGIINGIGHPTGESQPLWFTILSALLFLGVVVFGLDYLFRAGKD